MTKKDVFRIIDANLNRSREGLRVCEEITRFVIRSPLLTKEIKSARHKLSNILRGITLSRQMIWDTRDVASDVGRSARSASEMRRIDCVDIFSANIERVKESLRVLEEFFKLIDKSASKKVTALRFKVYDIEKRSLKKITGLRRLR